MTHFPSDLVGLIPSWLAELRIPGVSLAWVAEGKLTWAQGFGSRNLAAGLPVVPETIFEAASISKPVFACLALQMVQAGLLDLDVPLSYYLPQPYLPDEPRLEEITARRVLCHTSGLPNWQPDAEGLHTCFPPGARFSYSGEGYVYLQRVIECITGQPLEDWIRPNVFDPAGMTDSTFTWLPALDGCEAVNYDAQGTTCENRKPSIPNAAYTLSTTPTDLARFMTCLLNGSGAPLLTEPMLAAMLEPQVQVNDLAPWRESWPGGAYAEFSDVAWGLGWGIQTWRGDKAFFHWGDNGNAHAFMIGFCGSRTGLVAMTNSANGRSLWPRLFETVFGEGLPAIQWLEAMYRD